MSATDEEFDFEQETEDELYMEHRRKVIAFVMCLVLVVVVGFGSLLAYRIQKIEDSRIRDGSAQYNSELLPLFREKAELEAELANIGPAPSESSSSYGTVMFLCTEPGRWIDTEFKSVCDMYGAKCILAISETMYPGADGFLSLEETKKLVSGGWRLCISAETAAQVENVKAKLAADGFAVPDSVYLPSGTSEASADSFAEHGIKYVITHGEESGEAVWTVRAIGCCEIDSDDSLQTTAEQSGSLVITIGPQNERELYSVNSLSHLFNTVGEYVSRGQLSVTVDIEKSHVRRILYEDLVGTKEKEYLEKKNTLEKRLREVEAKILKYQSGGLD